MELESEVLGQSLAFPLQETVPSLCSLQLPLHQPQRLPSWEDCFPVLGRD